MVLDKFVFGQSKKANLLVNGAEPIATLHIKIDRNEERFVK